jgi:hypothetical protein
MELYSSSAVLAFPLDVLHSVACSGVRKLRDQEAASEAEALERWLADGGKLNFEKTWHSNVDASQSDTL